MIARKNATRVVHRDDSPEGDILDVVVVGAGMSGLLMGIRLMESGIRSFRIFEKADSIGGTWRENRYPGLACDVPSFFYAYSFEPNLDWSHRFSPGPEIRAYFERVTDKYGVRPYITFGSAVERAEYETGLWRIETSGGESLRCKVLIAATGPLHHKNDPDIEGLEDFRGACFHSADWDEDIALEGKRIGVIGNGSTGVQMMTPLSKVAAKVTMFQRTAQWIYPLSNVAYTDAQRARKRRLPVLAWLARQFYKQIFELSSTIVTKPGFLRMNLARTVKKHLETISDPELRARLTPDYEPGCKRLVISGDFYETMQRKNVELVVDPIERVEGRGVVTADGRLHELDVLVLATGFRAHQWGVDRVVGAGGESLQEAWARGTRTYRSIAVPGFPNFFMMCGPNSPIGNISVIDVSETQAGYIIDCLERLLRPGAAPIMPREDATRAFHRELLVAMMGTVWVTGCNSWYLDPDGVPTLWPWSARRFHHDMRAPRFEDYEEVSDR